MTCEFDTDHCLWGLGANPPSVCCDRGSDYPELYNFNRADTGNRQCCYVGIWNQSGRTCTGTDRFNEQSDGRYCGFGCERCSDRDEGLDQYEFLDGARWLMPSQVSGQRPWDARGMIHDLRSNQYHPIPGRIVYERGTCWQNDGLECFGADACACFGANTIDPIVENGECSPVGSPLPGLLPDEFFRTGYHWPPNSVEGSGQGNEIWHCRKFGETRLPAAAGGGHVRSTVIVDPTHSGGMDGVTERLMDPALLSSNVCQSDRLAHCTGRFAPGSPCYLNSAHGVCTEHNTPEHCGDQYHDSAGRNGLFDHLKIDRDNTAHIVGSDDGYSQLAGPTAAWKNAILDIVKTVEFPLEPEEGGAERTISFGALDHQEGLRIYPSNSAIGWFQREWFGTAVTAVKVPNGSGTGRLRQAGCLFDYSTFITRVKIVCRLILQQHRHVNPDDTRKYIYPLARLHIIALTSIRIGNLHRPTERGVDVGCGFVSSRDGEPVDLDVRNEWMGEGFSNVLYGLARQQPPVDPGLFEPEIGVADYGESFMFFNSDGQQFIPSPFVEWRGFLGGHSKPTSEDQREGIGTGLSCTRIAELRLAVPGWPTHVDTPGGADGDDPAGVYGGHVVVEFEQ